MTKKLINFSIIIYQNLTRSRFPTCRYSPTCSQYAIEAIEKHGLFKGSYLSVKRILSCHPFSKRPVLDPVPDSHKFAQKIRAKFVSS